MNMKAYKPFIVLCKYLFFVLLSALISLNANAQWLVPQVLTGTWSGYEGIVFRTKAKNEPYRFLFDSVKTLIIIDADNSVYGSVGDAVFSKCSIKKNRGRLGKKLNMFTDYKISGMLNGPVSKKDSLIWREIMIPFNFIDGTMRGTLFMNKSAEGIANFPMLNIRLTKINSHEK
jgi:hypothetical protein